MYALPMVVLAIVVSLGNLGLEHAQIFLAGRKFKLNALWANAGLVGCAVAVGVCILGVVVIPAFGERPGGVPAAWLWIALIQVPLLLQTSTGPTCCNWLGTRAERWESRCWAPWRKTGVVLLLFALGDLTPFSVLLLTGMTTLITWGGTRDDRCPGRIGLLADRPIGASDGHLIRPACPNWASCSCSSSFVSTNSWCSGSWASKPSVYSLAATLRRTPLAPERIPSRRRSCAISRSRRRRNVTLGTPRLALGLFLTGSAAFVAWVVIPWAIRVTYGEAFMGAVWPFRLLLPGMLLSRSSGPSRRSCSSEDVRDWSARSGRSPSPSMSG